MPEDRREWVKKQLKSGKELFLSGLVFTLPPELFAFMTVSGVKSCCERLRPSFELAKHFVSQLLRKDTLSCLPIFSFPRSKLTERNVPSWTWTIGLSNSFIVNKKTHSQPVWVWSVVCAEVEERFTQGWLSLSSSALLLLVSWGKQSNPTYLLLFGGDGYTQILGLLWDWVGWDIFVHRILGLLVNCTSSVR